jgi:hypothetical protein
LEVIRKEFVPAMEWRNGEMEKWIWVRQCGPLRRIENGGALPQSVENKKAARAGGLNPAKLGWRG